MRLDISARFLLILQEVEKMCFFPFQSLLSAPCQTRHASSFECRSNRTSTRGRAEPEFYKEVHWLLSEVCHQLAWDILWLHLCFFMWCCSSQLCFYILIANVAQGFLRKLLRCWRIAMFSCEVEREIMRRMPKKRSTYL